MKISRRNRSEIRQRSISPKLEEKGEPSPTRVHSGLECTQQTGVYTADWSVQGGWWGTEWSVLIIIAGNNPFLVIKNKWLFISSDGFSALEKKRP
jgi:hypothetical protein